MLLRVLVCAMSLAFAAGAAAQAYRWVDKDGKVRYGDTPPPGVKASPLKLPQGGGANVVSPPDDAAGKAAKKGPLTPAEQDAEYPQAPGRRAEGPRQGGPGADAMPRPGRTTASAPGKVSPRWRAGSASRAIAPKASATTSTIRCARRKPRGRASPSTAGAIEPPQRARPERATPARFLGIRAQRSVDLHPVAVREARDPARRGARRCPRAGRAAARCQQRRAHRGARLQLQGDAGPGAPAAPARLQRAAWP